MPTGRRCCDDAIVRTSLLSLLVLCTTATLSCAASAPVFPQARLATATPAGDAQRPPLTRRAILRYEIHGRPFPLPVVMGTIAGQPVLMLVDTIATYRIDKPEMAIDGWGALSPSTLLATEVLPAPRFHTSATPACSRLGHNRQHPRALESRRVCAVGPTTGTR